MVGWLQGGERRGQNGGEARRGMEREEARERGRGKGKGRRGRKGFKTQTLYGPWVKFLDTTLIYIMKNYCP